MTPDRRRWAVGYLISTMNDLEADAKIFLRLVEVMLPEAERIVVGAGRNMPFAQFVTGVIHRVLDRQADAEKYFRRANDLMPGVDNTLLELVRCLGSQGKHNEALEFASEAAEAYPESPAALGDLAMSLILVGKKTEARNYLDKALEIDPNDSVNRQILRNFDDGS